MRHGWLILLLLASGQAHAASFDCAKARTPQEKTICASQALSAADSQLNSAYQTLLAIVPPETAAQVRDSQRQWLRSLPITCAGRPNAIAGLLERCLGDAYRQRINLLQHAVSYQGGVQFYWKSVTLTAPDDAKAVQGDREHGVLSAHGILNASWPQSLVHTPQWQAWNRAMEDAARNLASQGSARPGGNWKQAWAVDMDTDVGVTINIVTPDLVASTVSNQWYGHGAAHPNITTVQFNWLLNQPRALRPDDVFRPDSGWESFLEQRCMKELKTQFGPDYPQNAWAPGYIEKSLLGIVTHPANWQLSSDALTIPFDAGSVACHACGAEPVVIPWTELKPMLQPAFSIPRETPESPPPASPTAQHR
jgi:uncharacterized protein